MVLFSAAVVVAVLAVPGPTLGQSPDPAPILPAGAQFPVDGDALPDGFQFRDPSLVAGRDGTIVLLGSSGGSKARLGPPTVAIRAPGDGTWTTAIVDDLQGFRPPRGMTATAGFRPVAIAAGPDGYAALGRALYYTACPRSCAQEARLVSLIWLSKDGRDWRRVDARTILGMTASPALQSILPAKDGGWIVAGSTATNLRKPSSLVILRSTDGQDWSVASTITGPRSLEAGRLFDVGETLVLEGTELPCKRDSLHHSLVAGGDADTLLFTIQQPRAWRADGPEGRWTPVDLAATGVIDVPPRPRSRDCARHLESEVQDRLRGSGRLVGVAGDRLLAVDGEVTRIASTSDVASWTTGDLPGSVPDDQTSTARGVRSLTPSAGDDGSLSLLSVETRRDAAEDWVNAGAEQTLAWRSTDDGATWARLPAGRPYFTRPVDALVTDPVGAVLTLLPGGVALLAATDHGHPERSTIRLGTAGPLVPWGTCTLAAGADCSFATIDADAAGADLTGIDLSGARVGYADWTGAVLRDSRMRGANISADLSGADLSGAQLTGASLWGATDGAVAAGADLRNAMFGLGLLAGGPADVRLSGARIDVPVVQPPGLDLAGLDLTGVGFSGPYDGVGDLRGLDFGNARLDSARFDHVDLTGADLRRTRFETLSFSSVTCPDGKPMSAGVFGADACRLKGR